jgi:hypothetical protein
MKRIACYLFFVIVVLQASPSCIPSQESLTERKIEEIEFKGNYQNVSPLMLARKIGNYR